MFAVKYLKKKFWGLNQVSLKFVPKWDNQQYFVFRSDTSLPTNLHELKASVGLYNCQILIDVMGQISYFGYIYQSLQTTDASWRIYGSVYHWWHLLCVVRSRQYFIRTDADLLSIWRVERDFCYIWPKILPFRLILHVILGRLANRESMETHIILCGVMPLESTVLAAWLYIITGSKLKKIYQSHIIRYYEISRMFPVHKMLLPHWVARWPSYAITMNSYADVCEACNFVIVWNSAGIQFNMT